MSLKQHLTHLYDKWCSFAAVVNSGKIWSDLRLKPQSYKTIHAATVNYCNAKCVFCGQHSFKRPSGVMDRTLYAKLLDEGREMGMDEVDFTPPLGDPLLDEHLFDRIAYARQIGYKKIYITTNGILLEKDSLFKQVGTHIDVVKISIGGLNRESYKRAYRVDKFQQVYFGILLLLEYVEYHFKGKRNVHLFFRSGDKRSEILNSFEFKEIKRIGGKSFTYEFTNFYDNWGGSVKEDMLYGEMKMRSIKKKIGVPCRALRDFFVEYQGNVRMCGCRFLDKEDDGLVVGNVGKEPLKDILSHERVLAMMEKFKSEETLPEVCRDCTLYRPIT